MRVYLAGPDVFLPDPLKIAKSAGPGTEAPPAPPEVADQLAGLFQFEPAGATQKRCWARQKDVRNEKTKVSLRSFILIVFTRFFRNRGKNTVYTGV